MKIRKKVPRKSLSIYNKSQWKDSILDSCIRRAAEQTGVDYKAAMYLFYNYWREVKEVIDGKSYMDIDLLGLGTMKCNLDRLYTAKVLRVTNGLNSGFKKYRNPETIADSLRVQRLIPRLKFERKYRLKRFDEILADPKLKVFTDEERYLGLSKDKHYIK